MVGRNEGFSPNLLHSLSLGLHGLFVAIGRSHGALGGHLAALGGGAANDIASDFDVVVLKLLLG